MTISKHFNINQLLCYILTFGTGCSVTIQTAHCSRDWFAVLMVDMAEDSINHDDDGFDSEETPTLVRSKNDYYNSQENVWLKQENLTKPKPTRGNSESIGSLSTDTSDHDYYNEFQPRVNSDIVFSERASVLPSLERDGVATSAV